MTTLTSTRQKLLETAHGLFYRDGFHSVGLDRILSEVGVTKTTFYNHFESKDDLMLEVLRMHDKWWRDTFREKLREHGGDTPRDQLMAVFDVIEEMFRTTEFHGCIFINVAVEFPLAHDPAHQAAAQHKRAMEDILRELAGYAGAKNPKAFAQELALLMEGTYVTQQVTSDLETVNIGRRIAQLLIDRHLKKS